MDEDFDRQKIMETIFDSNTSIILSELEDGSKDSLYLKEKLNLTEEEIEKRLSYLVKHGFVIVKQEKTKKLFSVDKEKLSKILESDESFSSVTEGLTKLDSYLN